MTSWGADQAHSADLNSVLTSLQAGNWLAPGLQGMQVGLDVLGYVADPFGSLISAGIGFILDELEPFPTWLDQLCGDPDSIRSMVCSWQHVSQQIDANAAAARQVSNGALAAWDGVAAVAFRGAAEASVGVIELCGTSAAAVAQAVELAGAIVAGVRSFVRDTIADLVGYALGKAVELLTVVLAPTALASVIAKVARTAARIRNFLDDLVSSGNRLADLLDTVRRACQGLEAELGTWFDSLPGTVVTEGVGYVSQ